MKVSVIVLENHNKRDTTTLKNMQKVQAISRMVTIYENI